MVRYKAMVLIFLLCFVAATPESANSEATKYSYIRLHVLANSNSPDDQAVKLRVRDAILKEHSMALKDVGNKSDSKEIITMHLSDIEKTARQTLRQYGFSDNVIAAYSQEQFPEKKYGNIVYPSGEYTALRVVIGSGEGHNWWCVMFPPLCIGADAIQENEEEETVIFDFKIRELFKSLKSDIKRILA